MWIAHQSVISIRNITIVMLLKPYDIEILTGGSSYDFCQRQKGLQESRQSWTSPQRKCVDHIFSKCDKRSEDKLFQTTNKRSSIAYSAQANFLTTRRTFNECALVISIKWRHFVRVNIMPYANFLGNRFTRNEPTVSTTMSGFCHSHKLTFEGLFSICQKHTNKNKTSYEYFPLSSHFQLLPKTYFFKTLTSTFVQRR